MTKERGARTLRRRPRNDLGAIKLFTDHARGGDPELPLLVAGEAGLDQPATVRMAFAVYTTNHRSITMDFPRLQHSSLVAMTLSLGLALSAVAQTSETGTSGSQASAAANGQGTKTGPLAAADRKFAEKAAIGGMAEVELGKLAQEKGASDEVKKFGEHMVQDHGKANEELKRIASSKGIQPPAAPDKMYEIPLQKLQILSGAEFDRAYMKQMVADHNKTVADFQKEADSGKDPELKSFAASTLPTLEQHLKMAQSVSDATKSAKASHKKSS